MRYTALVVLPLALGIGMVATAESADEERVEALDSLESVAPASPDVEEAASIDEPESEEEIRAMLFPLVQVRKSEHREKVKVGNFIVGEMYSYKRHGDQSKTEILDVPFASLLRREEHGPDDKEVSILNLPGTSLVEAKRDGEASSLKLVDVPLFTLLDTKDHGNGEFDNKFLKLPIVGSLFRHKRTENKEKIRFLFFSHTRTFNGDDRDRRAERRETRIERQRIERNSRY